MRLICSPALLLAPLALTLFFSTFLAAQTTNCDITVNAGPDQVFCTPGQTLTLSGSITGVYLNASWSPATGLSNPNSLNTNAVVSTATNYVLSARSLTGPNLVTNGDFSQGNTGFTTQYNQGGSGQFGPLTNPGTYGITTRADLLHSQFAPCLDHSGNGQMLVVNGATIPRNVWCQTVTVQPNTEYVLSAWFAVVATQNPSIIRFTVNGTALGSNFTLPTTTCQWTEFFRLWNSGTNTSVQICIANVSTSAAGNDFCLDDISLRRVCTTTDTVSIMPANLNPAFNPLPALCQNSPAFNLNSLLTANSTPNGQWHVNGTPATTFDPASAGPGTFTLQYRVQNGPCADSLTRTFTVAALPRAGTPQSPPAVCQGSAQSISLNQWLTGADAGGTWSFASGPALPSGAFTPATGTLQTQNLQAGDYTFQYRVAGTAPCPDATADVVISILSLPIANAGSDRSIDCRMPQVSIGSNASSSGANIVYQWTSPTGGVIAQPNLPITEVETAGTYVLTVRNTSTGCAASDTVVVNSLITEPQFSLIIKPVDCAGDRNGSIDVTELTNAASPVSYSLNNGPAQPSGNFANLASGSYTVRIEDANGCTAERTATLPEPPALTVQLTSDLPGNPPVLTLGDSTRLRILTNQAPSEIQSVVWTPPIPGCTDCTEATVGPVEATTYSVILTNKNGCRDSASITIRVELAQRIFVPTAFSPNDDGINDRLSLLSGPEVAQILSFRIIDRWGNLVFQQQNIPPNDPLHGWDGKVKGKPAAAGVYIYFAEVELVNGRRVLQSGETLLLK